MKESIKLIRGYVVEEKKGNKSFFQIFFSEVPKGVMRDIRSLIKINDGRVHRNSVGGITITANNPCCPKSVSNLALDIGDLGKGLTVDTQTFPILF
ncbi:MAG: hypothetical protein AAB940_01140 [Patescibacteria group bacterium]